MLQFMVDNGETQKYSSSPSSKRRTIAALPKIPKVTKKQHEYYITFDLPFPTVRGGQGLFLQFVIFSSRIALMKGDGHFSNATHARENTKQPKAQHDQ